MNKNTKKTASPVVKKKTNDPLDFSAEFESDYSENQSDRKKGELSDTHSIEFEGPNFKFKAWIKK